VVLDRCSPEGSTDPEPTWDMSMPRPARIQGLAVRNLEKKGRHS
jgi:hypothetical protein